MVDFHVFCMECLRCVWGLAGALDRNLTVENGLAIQLLDGTVGLRGGGNVNKGVSDRASGVRVDGDTGDHATKYGNVSLDSKPSNVGMIHVHKVVLKEVLQVFLGGRIGEISNI